MDADYPILEFDPSREAVIEPSRVVQPIWNLESGIWDLGSRMRRAHLESGIWNLESLVRPTPCVRSIPWTRPRSTCSRS